MAQKVKAYTIHRFPLFHHDDGVYITQSPVEVSLNPWLQAQIDAGIVGTAEQGKQSDTSDDDDDKDESGKPKTKRSKTSA